MFAGDDGKGMGGGGGGSGGGGGVGVGGAGGAGGAGGGEGGGSTGPHRQTYVAEHSTAVLSRGLCKIFWLLCLGA